MEDMTAWLRSIWEHSHQGIIWVWSCITGGLLYLVDPSAAFWGLLWVMLGDMISRLLAETVKAGGLLRAIKRRGIRSKALFCGSAVKFLGYYLLAVVACQFQKVAGIELISGVLSTIIYAFLFVVEAISIVENLIDAGLDDLRPLLLRFQRERDQLTTVGSAAGEGAEPEHEEGGIR